MRTSLSKSSTRCFRSWTFEMARMNLLITGSEMYRILLMAAFLVTIPAPGRAGDAPENPMAPCCQASAQDANELDLVLKGLQQKAADLESYQARIDYLVRQPLLESQQRRKGALYYVKSDNRSNLRIDFQTLQQDDEKEQKYTEQFLFDGVWLWHVDHQTERVERRQLAEPNEPIDAFALASRHIPVVGFSKVDDLRQQFDVELIPEPQGSASVLQHLRLKVKPDSVYKDDYVTIDFWIDRKVGLPAKVVAVNTEEDIHEIRLLEPKVNAALDRKMFQIDIPRHFSVDVVPLDRKAPPK